VGEFVRKQLSVWGLKPEQVQRVNGGERYTVTLPKQGVELVLQCTNKTGKDAQNPERWGLAEVKLLTQNAKPSSHWQGLWLGNLQPNGTEATLLAQARALWDEELANTGDQQTFFVDGPQGAQCAINLAWTSVADRLGSLKVLHMGGYLPWTALWQGRRVTPTLSGGCLRWCRSCLWPVSRLEVVLGQTLNFVFGAQHHTHALVQLGGL
jgi:hypothetical protein